MTTPNNHVYVIDDDRSIRWVLEKAFQGAGMVVTCFESAESALEALASTVPDVLISDIRMPGMDGLALLEKITAQYPDLPVVIMTAHSDLDSAVSAFKGGAFEYLPKPFDIDDAVAVVTRAIGVSNEKQGSVNGNGSDGVSEIIGKAPAMQEVFRAIGRLSQSNATVLINGESGTGKELVAISLHRNSQRADKPFLALNMAAIPKDLLESELFGHERGAFTGAHNRRMGRFEQADGGTLMLDEIGDMPAELQTRLLRVLADGEFYPVGAHTPTRVDVRIIAATHQNLEQLVSDGRFREDLFHRLNVIRIHIPSLRERTEDIPMLMKHFLHSAAVELGVEQKTLDSGAEKKLQTLDWPGNVRQLENLCRWLTVMASGNVIRLEDMPDDLQIKDVTDSATAGDWQSGLRQWALQQMAEGKQKILNEAIPAFEQIMIEAALQQSGGRKQDAAKLLGWGRNTLTRKIKELGLNARTSD